MDYCKQQERDGHRDDGDVTEWKVAELRAVVEAQDPACKVSPSPSPQLVHLLRMYDSPSLGAFPPSMAL